MIDLKNYLLKRVIKTGMIIPFAADNISKIPAGFLNCDGSSISRELYSGLFDVIGTGYGSGDGTTTFNLPNLTTFYLLNGLNVLTPEQNCKGNGLALGMYNGGSTGGIGQYNYGNYGGGTGIQVELYGKAYGSAAATLGLAGVGSAWGVTPDASKSGIKRDAVTSSISNKIAVLGIIKY